MIELPYDKGMEILRVEVGSTLHGTGLGVAHEDHDEMGIFIEWPRTTIGLGECDHYVKRTAPDGERSQPGDTDLVVYSLRKWARLTLNGNPSTLLPLFAPDDKVILTTPLGDELRAHAQWFASRRAGRAFLGYMEKQRQRLTGKRGRAGRVRTQPDGTPDWKYAMHMLRLGYQGREFLKTGRIALPMPAEPHGDFLRSVRQGEVPFDVVMHMSEMLETIVRDLIGNGSPLPDEPMRSAVDGFVQAAHLSAWQANMTLVRTTEM